MGDEKEKRTKASHLLMESSRLHKSFQSTIVISVFRLPAHRPELPDTPPNQSWRLRSILAHWNLLPWHKRWIYRNWCSQPMTLLHHVHTTCHWCQCDWQWSELQWVCQDRTRKVSDGSLHSENIPVLECEACVGDRAGMEKLKEKRERERKRERAPYCFLILFALMRCHLISIFKQNIGLDHIWSTTNSTVSLKTSRNIWYFRLWECNHAIVLFSHKLPHIVRQRVKWTMSFVPFNSRVFLNFADIFTSR